MTASTHQPAIQAWLDSLTPVERYRIRWLLNRLPVSVMRRFKYRPDRIMHYYESFEWEYSTGTAGQETERR